MKKTCLAIIAVFYACTFVNGDDYNNGGGVIYGSILGDMYFAPIASTGGANRVLSDADIANRVALKISSNGVVYAKELNIQTSIFPDYVFKKDYRLMSLPELRAYIDKNKHLPEIPSAHEAEENGVNLGEMNKLLLKKVEELTLYLIEKDKEVNDQKKINQKLIDRLDALEQKVNTATTQPILKH
ncbi:hypothetical protein HQ865_15320 [Mucilaginibacter mali]|uniref:Uncharacterized protein n=1 Tax=Mucilaginibacter mali TaxID=2740462 RepID=A0A7D4Q256_9SPHI|nr:hypothetical protein [Mucilaginibacter mali]QKJ31066.1 hypothetical protein HQ865_15320 [Mucilaginibacter mali]